MRIPRNETANRVFHRVCVGVLLLLMVTCARVVFGQDTTKVVHHGLPPLPDSVATPIGYMRVIKVPVPCGDRTAIGCFAVLERVIYVRDSMPPLMSWKSYLHELGHVRLFDQRILLHSTDLEESVVDLWATLWLQDMLARFP